MIEAGIVSLALADATTSALIGNRFYALTLPTVAANTNPTLPAATYRTVSTTEQYTNDGPLGFVQVRMQIDSWGATYKDAKSVSVALRTLLNGYSGTLPSGDVVLSITRDGEYSGFDEYIRLPYISTDWLIQFAG